MGYPGRMASNSRIIGFTLFKIGFVVVLFVVFVLVAPRYGKELGKLFLPERFKAAAPVREDVQSGSAVQAGPPVKSEPLAWDPGKQALPPGMEAMKPGSPLAEDRERANERVTSLDVAVAIWYSCQGGAAMAIQPFVEIDIQPVTRKRSPLEILKERCEIIDSKPRVIDSEEVDLDAGLKEWWYQQEKATEALRSAFDKGAFPPAREDALRALLDEQEILLKRIKQERDSLCKKFGLR